MDIITHAGIGLIAAAPFLAENKPEIALGLVVGSVLPDMDAFSRVLGKRAFLRFHQSWTHGLPCQALGSLIVCMLGTLVGWNGAALGIAVFTGLAAHTVLDLTNTYGVALFTPLSRKRHCLEWVFFIDAVVLCGTICTLLLLAPAWLKDAQIQPAYSASFFVFLLSYVLCKGWLKTRAEQFVPAATSLVPSALSPWHFYATHYDKAIVHVSRLNALTGTLHLLQTARVFDAEFRPILEGVPEFGLMQQLSAQYHVVRASSDSSGFLLLCRDMRIRNFGTRFGDLELWLDANKKIVRTRFHV